MTLGGGFPDRQLIQEMTAKMLIEVKAIQFRPANPFVFTSGWASPVYIDCRKLISYPRVRQTLIEFATATILRDIGFEAIDGIAGGETAGIPFAAWIADRLMLPMQYIRKKPKGFGRNAQIEGELRQGARTLLVEDLTTDARSKVNFCNALREAGAVVEHAFVVFHYGVFPTSARTMAEIGVTLHALATWWDVFREAKASQVFDSPTLAEVERFLHDPVSWSAAHGGNTEAALH
jgi:orotate phosphoribosyltransferase